VENNGINSMQKIIKMKNYITDILLGVAVGDAIGVPQRQRLRAVWQGYFMVQIRFRNIGF
jgi:ADP-ribosylglycohydrolase